MESYLVRDDGLIFYLAQAVEYGVIPQYSLASKALGSAVAEKTVEYN